jgi:hypothetical protein
MSNLEKSIWNTEVSGKIELADYWQDTDWATKKSDLEKMISSVTTAIEQLGVTITGQATDYRLQNVKTTLKGKGFDVSQVDTEEEADNMLAWADLDDKNQESIDKFQKHLSAPVLR